MFSLAVAFIVLHTFNLAIPGVDYYIPSSEIGIWGYFISVPVMLLGLTIGAVGSFGEQLQEKWLERDRDEQG